MVRPYRAPYHDSLIRYKQLLHSAVNTRLDGLYLLQKLFIGIMYNCMWWSTPPEGTLGSLVGLLNPCGGGVEYLHRDPASHKRRRKGKSENWDSEIWPRVLRDSDPKMIAKARASSNCKGQTRPLVREGARNQQTRNCQTIIKIWSYAPDGCFIPRQTGRLAVSRNGRNIKLKTQ
jgi:hypothetical protein